MPSHYYRKKRNRKYKRKRKQNTGFLRQVGTGLTRSYPLGKKFLFKTRYVESQIAIDPGAGGTPQTWIFALNGLYDPDTSGAGHQPLGFDQIMLMYNHYTVIGARVRATFVNTDTTYAQNVSLSLKDSSTATADFSRTIENGSSRWACVGTDGAPKTLSLNCSMNKFFGRKILQDNIFRGDISSNPDEIVYLHAQVSPTDAVNSTAVRMTIVIEYIAVMTEPKALTQS